MRIEVFLDKNGSKVYEFNKPRVVIGSTEGCDLVLNVPGVSRKHLLILQENETYFVVDQGSTNGTYIGNQKLTPGLRVEIATVVDIRLSDKLLISILQDDSAQFDQTSPNFKNLKEEISVNESTRIISL